MTVEELWFMFHSCGLMFWYGAIQPHQMGKGILVEGRYKFFTPHVCDMSGVIVLILSVCVSLCVSVCLTLTVERTNIQT